MFISFQFCKNELNITAKGCLRQHNVFVTYMWTFTNHLLQLCHYFLSHRNTKLWTLDRKTTRLSTMFYCKIDSLQNSCPFCNPADNNYCNFFLNTKIKAVADFLNFQFSVNTFSTFL